MRLHILSDLHVEFGDFSPPAVDADVVILAGDIGVGTGGLHWAAQRFPHRPAIYVPGNHEFYYRDTDLVDELQAEAPPHIHVLNDSQVVIAGVRFLGCTLWTDFALFGESGQALAMQQAACRMPDFNIVGHRGGPFTPDDALALHVTSRDWLGARLAEPFGGRTVVVSHHAPSPASVHPRYAEDPLTPAFASRLDHLFGAEQIALWVHGHTHEPFDYLVRGTRVICNPRGYAPDALQPAFRPALVVEI